MADQHHGDKFRKSQHYLLLYIHRVIFASCIFHLFTYANYCLFTHANSFAMSYISPDMVVFRKNITIRKNLPRLKFALLTMRAKGVKIIWGQIFSCIHTVYLCISSQYIYIPINIVSFSLCLRMMSRVEQRRHSTSGNL